MVASKPDQGPALLREELGRVLRLLSEYPDVGAIAEDPDLLGIRRVLLAATRHYLYYRVNEANQSVEVLAVWSTTRGKPPEWSPFMP